MKTRILLHASAFALIASLPLAAQATDDGGAGSSSGYSAEGSYEVQTSSPSDINSTDATMDAGGAGSTSGSVSGSGTLDQPAQGTNTGEALNEENGALSAPEEGTSESDAVGPDAGGAGSSSESLSGSGAIESASPSPNPQSEGQEQMGIGGSTDAEDQGGAGTTSGSVDSGSVTTEPAALPSPTPAADDASINGSESSDAGGAGSSSGASVGVDQVQGIVDSVDTTRRRLTIRDDQGNLVSYDLAAGGSVKIGERDSALSSLSNGDNVTITLSGDDPTKAEQIMATSGQ